MNKIKRETPITEFRWELEYHVKEDDPDYPKIDIPMDDLSLAKFDPWDCSEHKARSAMRLWIANGYDPIANNNPWFQYQAAIFITQHKEIIENKSKRNHGLNLMHCINWLFRYQLTAPEWLTVAFAQVCTPIFHLEAISWDVTLGKPVGRGVNQKRLDKIRERRKNITLVGEFIQRELRKTGSETKSHMLAQRAFPHLSDDEIDKCHEIYLRILKKQ